MDVVFRNTMDVTFLSMGVRVHYTMDVMCVFHGCHVPKYHGCNVLVSWMLCYHNTMDVMFLSMDVRVQYTTDVMCLFHGCQFQNTMDATRLPHGCHVPEYHGCNVPVSWMLCYHNTMDVMFVSMDVRVQNTTDVMCLFHGCHVPEYPRM